jgi:hypothetical protein
MRIFLPSLFEEMSLPDSCAGNVFTKVIIHTV